MVISDYSPHRAASAKSVEPSSLRTSLNGPTTAVGDQVVPRFAAAHCAVRRERVWGVTVTLRSYAAPLNSRHRSIALTHEIAHGRTESYAAVRALLAACSRTARTCSMVTPGNHSMN